MSVWSHIVGVIHIDTHKQVDNIEKFVRDALKSAPKITGSEGNATIFVNAEPGYSVSVYRDCRHCEYNDTIIRDSDGFSCDAPEEHHCPTRKYQTRAVVTVHGDLRDRTKKTTKKQWNAFQRFIAKNLGYEIRMASCRVDGW